MLWRKTLEALSRIYLMSCEKFVSESCSRKFISEFMKSFRNSIQKILLWKECSKKFKMNKSDITLKIIK